MLSGRHFSLLFEISSVSRHTRLLILLDISESILLQKSKNRKLVNSHTISGKCVNLLWLKCSEQRCLRDFNDSGNFLSRLFEQVSTSSFLKRSPFWNKQALLILTISYEIIWFLLFLWKFYFMVLIHVEVILYYRH